MSAKAAIGLILAATGAYLGNAKVITGKITRRTRRGVKPVYVSLPAKDNYPSPPSKADRPSQVIRRGRDPRPILDIIAQAEAGPMGYDAINYGVAKHLHPRLPISQLTVGAVLSWQYAVDEYQTTGEAVGRYQFIKETLRDLIGRKGVTKESRFDAATQDKLAIALMEDAGLSAFFEGRWSVEKFGNRLARTWAGLPVLSNTRGHRRQVSAGQSYYASHAGNKATISLAAFRKALERSVS